MNIGDVDAMGVIQTGSRVVYRKLFSGSEDNLETFEKLLEKIPANIRVQNALDVGDNLGEDIAISSPRLSPTSNAFCTLILAGIFSNNFSKVSRLSSLPEKSFL